MFRLYGEHLSPTSSSAHGHDHTVFRGRVVVALVVEISLGFTAVNKGYQSCFDEACIDRMTFQLLLGIAQIFV